MDGTASQTSPNYRAVVVSLNTLTESSITVNQEAQFSIDISKAGCAPLGVRIVDSQKKDVACRIEEIVRDKHTCTFTPTAVGQHMIMISFGNMNVVGCPFKVEVTAPASSLPLVPFNTEHMKIPEELQDCVKRPLQFEVKGTLGHGQFGEVIEVEVRFEQNEAKNYAAKISKDENSSNIFQEAILMHKFKHIHVMNLEAIVLYSNRVYILMPLMRQGNLRDYLVKNKKSIQDVNILIDYTYQVACAMKYISELHFVHRDLAARNCLLSDTNLLKVSDFGLTRDNFKEYYKMINKQNRLPLKWVAPEVFENFIFTTASDVWAFGVLVWEIFTFGEEPYGGAMEGQHISGFLNAGSRLSAPEKAPKQMYDLMKQCWDQEPERRPRFDKICNEIEKISTETGCLLMKYKNI